MTAWLSAPFVSIYGYRRVLGRTLVQSLKANFAGSILGVVWLILGPLLLLILYALIYAVVFQVRPVGMSQTGYILYVFSGLVPFLAFSAALNAGTTSLSTNKELLLSTVFPPELVPLRIVIANSATILSGVVIIGVISAFTGHLSWAWLAIPIVALGQLMFVIGVVWVLSLANLLIRDIQQLLMYATISLLIVTPIAYTPEMIPDSLKAVIYLNPLSYYIISFQHIFVLGRVPPAEIATIGCLLSILSFCGAHAIFNRAKQVFLDHV